MGRPQLVARLEREVDARLAQIEAETRRYLEAMERERQRTSAETRSAELTRRQRLRRVGLEQEIAEARRRARTTVLRAHRQFIDRVLQRVEEMLKAATADVQFLRLIPVQLHEAMRFMDEGPTVVRCPPSLERVLHDALPPEGMVTVAADPEAPVGWRLIGRSGAVVVDDTLQGRLLRLRDEVGPALIAGVGR